jgi:hypothetical protein
VKKLFLRGGLGNQLFQLAFIHRNSFELEEKFELWMVDLQRPDLNFVLNPVVGHCKHIVELSTENALILSDFQGPNVVPYHQVQGNLLVESVEHLYEEFDTSLYDGIFGHFENSRYVDEAWARFGEELVQGLESIQGLDSLPPDGEYIALHFRRGDFSQFHPTGLLDKGYYEEALNKIPAEDRKRLPIFGFTDDLERVQVLASELGVMQLFGRETSTAWQALKAISEAKHVVAANSTLSWWAAYIATRAGRQSYIPRPWFPDWHESIANCLEFQGTNIVQSVFEIH